MIKKLIDLTLEDCKKICDREESCITCPLASYSKISCYKADLEKVHSNYAYMFNKEFSL